MTTRRKMASLSVTFSARKRTLASALADVRRQLATFYKGTKPMKRQRKRVTTARSGRESPKSERKNG